MRPLATLALATLLLVPANPVDADSSAIDATVAQPAADIYEAAVGVGLNGGGTTPAGTDPLRNCTFAWNVTDQQVMTAADKASLMYDLSEIYILGSNDQFNYILCPQPNPSLYV